MPASKRDQVDSIVADLGRARRILADLEARTLALLGDAPVPKTDDDLGTEFDTISAKAWRLSQQGRTVEEISAAMLLTQGTVRRYLGEERRRLARAPQPKRRRRGPKDPDPRLLTSAAPDGHAHVAEIRADGSGKTTPGPDGHVHTIRDLEIAPGPGGHRHKLTEVRE